MYVYLITNTVNGKRYVGQTTTSLSNRWNGHTSGARTGLYDWPLHRAIRKYGENNFQIKILAKCSTVQEMDHRETYYIKILKTLCPNGYNAQSGGHVNHTVSKETRMKKSQSVTGSKNPRFGKKNSPEHRHKISKARKGRPGNRPSEEGLRKISKSNTGKRPFLNKRHTEDTKLRMSLARNHVKIKIFCVTNNITYNSLTEASKALGVERCKIKEVIKATRNHTKGFVFRKA